MELTIETGIAMPKNARKNSSKEASWVKSFKAVKETVDIMQPNQSFAFNTAKPARDRRDLVWILNKYGLQVGKRFAIVATEPAPEIPAMEAVEAVIDAEGNIVTPAMPATEAVPAVPGNVRVFCVESGLPSEAYEAGESYTETLAELFAE